MKNLIKTTFSFALISFLFIGMKPIKPIEKSCFSELTPEEKKEALASIVSGDCSWNGIKLYGKVEFVSSYADIKIQYVSSYGDIKVKMVDSYPNECGKWQSVSSYGDFKVQVVDSYPDIKVQLVDSYPGMN